jgi:hypothetical protein
MTQRRKMLSGKTKERTKTVNDDGTRTKHGGLDKHRSHFSELNVLVWMCSRTSSDALLVTSYLSFDSALYLLDLRFEINSTVLLFNLR